MYPKVESSGFKGLAFRLSDSCGERERLQHQEEAGCRLSRYTYVHITLWVVGYRF